MSEFDAQGNPVEQVAPVVEQVAASEPIVEQAAAIVEPAVEKVEDAAVAGVEIAVGAVAEVGSVAEEQAAGIGADLKALEARFRSGEVMVAAEIAAMFDGLRKRESGLMSVIIHYEENMQTAEPFVAMHKMMAAARQALSSL